MSTITYTAADQHRVRPSARFQITGIWPGLFLTILVACAAYGVHSLPIVSTFSPLIIAILLGMIFHNVVGTPASAKPGVTFSLRRILRLAIILLGLQLTAMQIGEVGATGIGIIAVTLAATFLFTGWFGRVMGIDPKLAQLIGAGTSVCGASAVIATNTVTDANDEDVAYAVACVTVFGSIAMFAYPTLSTLLHLDPRAYGLWAGSSIHEIAQVVAAAFQEGRQAGEFGTIAKLSRVMLLAPLVIALGVTAARRNKGTSSARPPMPWFVLGFIAMIALNSLITIPPDAKSVTVSVTTFLLTMALAAMGLETDIRKLYAKGLRPLVVGATASIFISLLSLTLIKLTS
jgi:uncharacterized integral membrane protein (TIGR00698 family)